MPMLSDPSDVALKHGARNLTILLDVANIWHGRMTRNLGCQKAILPNVANMWQNSFLARNK